MRSIQICSLAFFAIVLGGCSSPYYSYRYEPSPLEAEVKWENAPSAQGRALISVVGVRKADKQDEQPAGVHLRMRFENLGSDALVVDTDGMMLLSADLKQFGAPTVSPESNPQVPPGGETTLEFFFPCPAGKKPDELDMDGLNLRWSVSQRGEVVTSGVTFVRRSRDYYDDRSRSSFSFGVGFVDHN